MALALRFAARSDVGLIRDGNEDSGYAGPRLLAVADGMGGHAAGEVASSVAIATLSELDEDSAGPELLDRLSAAVQEANDHLRDMVVGDPALRGMGTTLTALLRSGSRFGVVHVGDSRCYLWRDGELTQITHDHTFVQALIDEGRLTAEEASTHPQRSLITNVLDGRGTVDADISVREARAGDRWLLCSDGLSGVVSEQTLAEALSHSTPDRAAEALVDLALRGGGPDNVTVIVADVVDVETSPPDIPEVVGAVGSAPVRYKRGADGSLAMGGSAAARAAALRPRPEDSVPAEDDHLDRAHARRRWPFVLMAVLVLAGLGVGAALAYQWSRDQYYVGADDTDHVAIYRGLSQNVLGLGLSDVYAAQDIPVEDLSEFEATRVRSTIAADDLPDAEAIVGRLRRVADVCGDVPRTPGPTPTPLPSGAPSAAPSGGPSPGASLAPPTGPLPRATVSNPSPLPSGNPAVGPSASLSPTEAPVEPGDCGGPS